MRMREVAIDRCHHDKEAHVLHAIERRAWLTVLHSCSYTLHKQHLSTYQGWTYAILHEHITMIREGPPTYPRCEISPFRLHVNFRTWRLTPAILNKLTSYIRWLAFFEFVTICSWCLVGLVLSCALSPKVGLAWVVPKKGKNNSSEFKVQVRQFDKRVSSPSEDKRPQRFMSLSN